MADVSITPGDVRLYTQDALPKTLLAGGTITAGDFVYFDSATRNWKRAQADGTAAESQAVYIALSDAASGEYFIGVDSTLVVIGMSALTLGVMYVVSATAGKMAPIGDLTTGQYITLVGVPSSTSVLDCKIHATLQTA